MLDGDRYYKDFPDERSGPSSLRALLGALAKLEQEFRKYLEEAGEGDQAETDPASPKEDTAGS